MTGAACCGGISCSCSCSDIETGYGRVVMLDLFDLADPRRESRRDNGLSPLDESENRLSIDAPSDGTGGGVEVGIGGVCDGAGEGVVGTHARSRRYSDTAVCLLRLR